MSAITVYSYHDITDDLADLVEQIVLTGECMTEALQVLGIPHYQFYKWLADGDPAVESPRARERRARFDRVREEGWDAIAQNTRKVARGQEGYSSGDSKRDRLIVETDLKLLAKWHPRKYGEKLQIESKSVNVEIPMSDDPVDAQRAYEKLIKGS